MKKNLLSIVIWSLIAAAFIGPGTVTTASAAGAAHGYDLIWALAFATIACMVIQEASARISIVNNQELPEVMTNAYAGTGALPLRILLAGSVIFGCAAYQAGNILGAISGMQLISDIPVKWAVAILAIVVAVLLYFGTYKNFAKILSAMVGIMGISFLLIILNTEHSASDIIVSFWPSIPENAGWLVIGLIGTTIVPYNLFLGSGISKGQSLKVMRIGLVISIGLGGIISIAILISGTLISGEFSFAKLSLAMMNSLGSWANYLLAFGLFAAGFTSSVTAPLAAAFIARGFFGQKNKERAYHLGWGIVLLTGFVVGMMDFKPVPVIILAQALNGFILPVIAVFLMVMVNDPRVLGQNRNTGIQNLVFTIILFIVLSIGLNNLLTALENFVEWGKFKIWIILCSSTLLVIASWIIIRRVQSGRS